MSLTPVIFAFQTCDTEPRQALASPRGSGSKTRYSTDHGSDFMRTCGALLPSDQIGWLAADTVPGQAGIGLARGTRHHCG